MSERVRGRYENVSPLTVVVSVAVEVVGLSTAGVVDVDCF